MGLLDKAATRQAPRSGGLLSKAEHVGPVKQNNRPVKPAVPPGTGKKKRIEADPSADKPVARGIISLATEISELSPSLEGIAELFELLKKTFGIKKGALLTRSSESEFFLPRAQTGLDITSRNRLRIPPAILSDQVTKGAWIRLTNLSTIQPYLSSREFALLESVSILPVYAETFCSGLFILFSDSYEQDKIRKLSQARIDPVQDAIGSYFTRIKLFQLTKTLETTGGSLELERFIHKMREYQMVFTAVRFNITPLLERLQTASHDVDLFRARKDTLRIIETLFEGSSVLVSLSADSYLLLLATKRQQNPGLLQHQVGLALQNFFSDSKTVLEFFPLPPPPPGISPKQAASELIAAW